jgi:hypothetical protein
VNKFDEIKARHATFGFMPDAGYSQCNADRAALIAMVEQLREALKPFADIGNRISADVSDQLAVKVPLYKISSVYVPPPGPKPDHYIPKYSLIYVGNLRDAQRALSLPPPELPDAAATEMARLMTNVDAPPQAQRSEPT